MNRIDIWDEDGPLDEAPARGATAASKFWRKDTEKACIELFGLNLDRGYRYHLYICFDSPESTKHAVERALSLFVGEPEWISLLLYEENEECPLDASWKPYREEELRDGLKRINERANSEGLKLVQERLTADILRNREIIVEYELSIRYAVEHDGEKIAVWVLGPNYLADVIPKNASEDLSTIGKVIEYDLREDGEVVLADIIEEEDYVTVRVRFETGLDKEAKK